MRVGFALTMILVFAVGVVSCGGDSSRDGATSRTSPPPGASSPKGTTGKPGMRKEPGFDEIQAKHPRLPALSGGSGFEGSMVRVSFLNTSNPFGVKSAVVYFVTTGPPRTALAQAKACVRTYLSKARSAYCFAFPSDRTFRFAKVRRRPPAEMERPCWSAYWGKPSGRRPIGSARNPAFAPLHCPAR